MRSKILTSFACLAALFVSACSPTMRQPAPVINTTVVSPIANIDERLKVPCSGPIPEPVPLTAENIRTGWNQDRARLRTCANRHGGLVRAVEAQAQ